MPIFLDLPSIKRIPIDMVSLSGDENKLTVKQAFFYRTADKFSVALFRAGANSEKFDEAVIIFERKAGEIIYQLKLKLAFIESYELNGVNESFAMQFTTMVVENKNMIFLEYFSDESNDGISETMKVLSGI